MYRLDRVLRLACLGTKFESLNWDGLVIFKGLHYWSTGKRNTEENVYMDKGKDDMMALV